MPTLAAITGTTGWYLAKYLGYFDLPGPQFGWVAAALTLLALMTIQGTGILLPTNLWVCFLVAETPQPDYEKISRVMRVFFGMVGFSGADADCHHCDHGAVRDRI